VTEGEAARRDWVRAARVLMSTRSGRRPDLLATEGGAELGGRWCDVALPVLAGEHRAATLTPVGCCRGEPG
jgi:hypothetical protein